VLADSTVESIRYALGKADKILVIAHIAPDGDAIGSLTAFGLALQQLGKAYTLVCDDGVPSRFDFLPFSGEVRTSPDAAIRYDLIISLDAGDTDRLGKAYSSLPRPTPPLINIDHHVTNTRYGDVNLVGEKASSTTEILFHLLPQLGVRLTSDMAMCLLTGLVTDTLCFRTSNVSASTLRTASGLIDAGADLAQVTEKAINLRSLSTLLVWEKGLNNMRMEDGILWTSISNDERLEAGHDGTSSFGLGNMMADVNQATMSAVLLELADGRISVGFRCRLPYSVSELALSLGGGGHHLAAGCTVDGPLKEAVALVVARSKETIGQQRAALAGNGQSAGN
jgi:phosphoesterase RecJ-like protein